MTGISDSSCDWIFVEKSQRLLAGGTSKSIELIELVHDVSREVGKEMIMSFISERYKLCYLRYDIFSRHGIVHNYRISQKYATLY